MIIPTTILDNFLDNPDDIKEWALTLNFQSPTDNVYPGKRTECLSNIFHPFFHLLNNKILSLLFPFSPPPSYSANTYFQYISDFEGSGWVHQDHNQITALIYLSPPDPNINRGTSMYKLKKGTIHPLFHTYNIPNFFDKRKKHYLSGKINNETLLEKDKFEKNTFEKILDVKDEYNRLLVFDPKIYHTNNSFSSPSSTKRLTLISFIDNIVSPYSFPSIRSKQTT